MIKNNYVKVIYVPVYLEMIFISLDPEYIFPAIDFWCIFIKIWTLMGYTPITSIEQFCSQLFYLIKQDFYRNLISKNINHEYIINVDPT